MAKLTVKAGDVECEFEGSEEFIKQDLLGLFREFAKLAPVSPLKDTKKNTPDGNGADIDTGVGESVTTLAQKLQATAGTDLIMAAALSFTKGGTPSFTKKQLRERIKNAHGFFKASHASNLDTYVTRLIKSGRLAHTGGENYALPAKELTALERKIAGPAN